MQKPEEMLVSAQNPFVKFVNSLSERKYREKEKTFRFDGKKLFYEALAKNLPLTAVLFRASSAEAIIAEVSEKELPQGCRALLLADALFDRISEEKSPEGVICLSKYPENLHRFAEIGQKEKEEREGFTLFLESIRDPGNLGTVIRSSKAFGVDKIVLSSDCADIYNSRTIRAAMGTLFAQPICIVKDFTGTLAAYAKEGRVFAAALDARARKLPEVSLKKGDAVAIGNEGHGLSKEALDACTESVYIPMEPFVESLNAGIAASVILWEYYRGL